MCDTSIVLRVDVSKVSGLLKALVDLPAERLELFFDALDGGVQLFCADVDKGAAMGAGEIRVVLKPTIFLAGFLLASGAWDGDFEILKN